MLISTKKHDFIESRRGLKIDEIVTKNNKSEGEQSRLLAAMTQVLGKSFWMKLTIIVEQQEKPRKEVINRKGHNK